MNGPAADDRASGYRGVWSLPLVRVTAVFGIAAVLLAVAAGVWAASWNQKSDPPPVLVEVPADDPTTPTPTPPTTRPVEPVDEEPPAPDTVAPAIPVVQSPADAITTRDPLTVFAGLGEPGAQLHLQLVDPADGRARTIAAVIVADDRTWSLAPATALPDGLHTLLVMQVDAAGNVSDAARRTITIDTVALPPTITALPTGPLVVLPVLEGTGEPLALVTVRDERGASLGVADVATDGRWRFALPDPGRDGMTLTATQTDGAGNISSPSSRTAPIVFARATVDAPADVVSTGGATVVDFSVTGTGVVEIAVDGIPTGQRLTLTGSPAAASTAALPDGTHTISVRYVDGSRVGVWTSVTVTITAATPEPTPSPTPTGTPTPSSTPTVEPAETATPEDATPEEPAEE